MFRYINRIILLQTACAIFTVPHTKTCWHWLCVSWDIATKISSIYFVLCFQARRWNFLKQCYGCLVMTVYLWVLYLWFYICGFEKTEITIVFKIVPALTMWHYFSCHFIIKSISSNCMHIMYSILNVIFILETN